MDRILIISFIVFAIWYTMQPGEIFGFLGSFFTKHLPPFLHNPIFDCPVCMVPWYGSVLYLIIWGYSLDLFIIVIAAMGFNVIITQFFRHG